MEFLTITPVLLLGLLVLVTPFIAGRRAARRNATPDFYVKRTASRVSARAAVVTTAVGDGMKGYIADDLTEVIRRIPKAEEYFLADPLGSSSLPDFLEDTRVADALTLEMMEAGHIPPGGPDHFPVNARWIPWGYDLSEAGGDDDSISTTALTVPSSLDHPSFACLAPAF